MPRRGDKRRREESLSPVGQLVTLVIAGDVRGVAGLMGEFRDAASLLSVRQRARKVLGGKSANALEVAASVGGVAMVSHLLDLGAELEGSNALLAAADAGRAEVVELLLSRGAELNTQTDTLSRHTALHLACRRGGTDAVHALLCAGDDPSRWTHGDRGSSLSAQPVRTLTCFENSPFVLAWRRHRVEVLESMVQAGAHGPVVCVAAWLSLRSGDVFWSRFFASFRADLTHLHVFHDCYQILEEGWADLPPTSAHNSAATVLCTRGAPSELVECFLACDLPEMHPPWNCGWRRFSEEEYESCVACLPLLLYAGFDPETSSENYYDNCRGMPEEVIEQDDAETMELLLSTGVTPEEPLCTAVNRRAWKTLRLLAHVSGLSGDCGEEILRALCNSVTHNLVEPVVLLTEAFLRVPVSGNERRWTTDRWQTPFDDVSSRGCVEFLLGNGCDVLEKPHGGYRTPLNYWMTDKRRKADVCRALFEGGATMGPDFRSTLWSRNSDRHISVLPVAAEFGAWTPSGEYGSSDLSNFSEYMAKRLLILREMESLVIANHLVANDCDTFPLPLPF